MTFEFTSLARASTCSCEGCHNLVLDGDGRQRELCDDCLFSECQDDGPCQAPNAKGIQLDRWRQS